MTWNYNGCRTLYATKLPSEIFWNTCRKMDLGSVFKRLVLGPLKKKHTFNPAWINLKINIGETELQKSVSGTGEK